MIRVQKKKIPYGAILGFIIIIALIILILNGVNTAKLSIHESARDRLQDAIKKTAIHAYAIDGQYPASIDYMEEHYGLRYDKKRFFVDYQLFASNVLPDIFIVDNEKEGGLNENS